MCVIIATKLNDKWVLGKNRDRNYKPTIKFSKYSKHGIEIRRFEDKNTLWTEGINSNGVCIINSALMVIEDEIEKKQVGISKNSGAVKSALAQKDLLKITTELVKNDIFGHTFITDGDELYIIETARKLPPDTDFSNPEEVANAKPIEQTMKWYKYEGDDKYLVRANHGSIFNELGYPIDIDSGKSSRKREHNVMNNFEKIKPKSIEDIFEVLSYTGSKDPNYNPLRERSKGTTLYTTAQYIFEPESKSIYFKPLDCEMVDNNIINDKTNIFMVDKDNNIKQQMKTFESYFKY